MGCPTEKQLSQKNEDGTLSIKYETKLIYIPEAGEEIARNIFISTTNEAVSLDSSNKEMFSSIEYTVIADKLNIRDMPNANANIVGAFLKGNTIKSINKSGDWIETNKGWVSTKFLNPTTNLREAKEVDTSNILIGIIILVGIIILRLLFRNKDNKVNSKKIEKVNNINSHNIVKDDEMNLEKIIEKVKDVYKGHNDLDEILNDLGNNDYFDHWAKRMCDKDELNNIELGKSFFILQENKCESSSDFRSLGEDVFDSLSDTEWSLRLLNKAIELSEDTSELLSIADSICPIDKEKAKVLYQKSENNLSELSEFNNIVSSVNDTLEDKGWALKLISKAKDSLLNAKDQFEFAGYSSEIITLAERIADEDLGNDRDSAKDVFELLKKYEGITDLLDAARAVKEVYLEDEEYASSYMEECLDKANEYLEEGYYCDVYNYIKDDMEDEERAKEFKDNYEDEMRNDHEQYGSCEEIFGENSDDEDDEDDESSEDVEVDTDATGYFKLEIIGTGGEYTYGFVTDENQKRLIKQKIEDTDICLDNYEDDIEVSFFQFDDVLHVYGPNGPDSKVSLTVYEDEECENEIEEVFDREDIDSLEATVFTSSNPDDFDAKENVDPEALIFGGYYIEKRIHYPAIIKINDDEKFEMSNVYIGTVNLDETLSNDEIVDRVLYIRPEVAEEIMKLYNCEDEQLSDYIGEIFSELEGLPERIKELLNNATCETLDIEGKGEREEQFVLIKNMDDDVLYEGHCNN